MLRPLKWYKSLQSVKGRIKAGAFLLEGPKALFQIQGAYPDFINEILIHETSVDKWDCKENTRILTPGQFASVSNNKSPQGVIGIITLPNECYSAKLPEKCGTKILLLEDIQDPGNIGTLVRTAAAFNFTGVILSKECADPFSPKAIQASAGSILSVWTRKTTQFQKLATSLKKKGFLIIATDIKGSSKSITFKEKKVALALGNEGKGLSGKILNLADTIFKIPFNANSAESLNVAAAGAICMYLMNR